MHYNPTLSCARVTFTFLSSCHLSLCHFCIACFIPCCRVPFVGRSRCGFDFMSFSMKFPWKSSNWITYEKQYRSAWRIGSLLNIHTHREDISHCCIYSSEKSAVPERCVMSVMRFFSGNYSTVCNSSPPIEMEWEWKEIVRIVTFKMQSIQSGVCVYASASAVLLAITANVHFVHFTHTNTHRRHNHTTVFTYSSLHVIRCAVGGKVVCRLLTIFQTKSTGKRFTIVHPSEDCQQYFLRPVD